MLNTMTPKQRGFLEKLARERQLTGVQETSLKELLDRADVPRGDASRMIDALMALPKKAAAPRARAVNFDGIPLGSYALTADDLDTHDVAHLAGHNDLAFFRVDEFKETVYLRQLHGAPGEFSKSKLALADARKVVDMIRTNPRAAGKRFADHYSRCAACHAELTDQDSRDRGYGPICWGRM